MILLCCWLIFVIMVLLLLTCAIIIIAFTVFFPVSKVAQFYTHNINDHKFNCVVIVNMSFFFVELIVDFIVNDANIYARQKPVFVAIELSTTPRHIPYFCRAYKKNGIACTFAEIKSILLLVIKENIYLKYFRSKKIFILNIFDQSK